MSELVSATSITPVIPTEPQLFALTARLLQDITTAFCQVRAKLDSFQDGFRMYQTRMQQLKDEYAEYLHILEAFMHTIQNGLPTDLERMLMDHQLIQFQQKLKYDANSLAFKWREHNVSST